MPLSAQRGIKLSELEGVKMQSGKSPNTRPQGESFQNKGEGRARSTVFWGKENFSPPDQATVKGKIPGAGSDTLNLKLQFLWGSRRGSNDKLINNFPFSLLDLGISCAAAILCSLCL